MQGIPLKGPQSFSAFVANLFMLQGLDAGELSWNYPAWSISVEFIAYLAFPFALPVIWRARAAVKIAISLVLFAALGVLAYVTRDDFNQWNGPITLLRCLPEFILGTLLYSAYRGGAFSDLLKEDSVAISIVVAVILCLHLGGPDLLTVALFAVLILATVGNSGRSALILNFAPFTWLGDISYSLYLIHSFVQFLTTRLLEAIGVYDRAHLTAGVSLVLMLVMVSVCLICASTTYFGVEIVWRKYVRRAFGSARSATAYSEQLQNACEQRARLPTVEVGHNSTRLVGPVFPHLVSELGSRINVAKYAKEAGCSFSQSQTAWLCSMVRGNHFCGNAIESIRAKHAVGEKGGNYASHIAKIGSCGCNGMPHRRGDSSVSRRRQCSTLGGHWGGHGGGWGWGGFGLGLGTGLALGAAPYYGGYYGYGPYAYDYGDCYIRRQWVVDGYGRRILRRVRVCY
jgi:hypothetical protein